MKQTERTLEVQRIEFANGTRIQIRCHTFCNRIDLYRYNTNFEKQKESGIKTQQD